MRQAPPERGAGAALGAVLLGPHKAPLVPPAIHAAQHERAGHEHSQDRSRLYRRPEVFPYTSQRPGHLTRSRPHGSSRPYGKVRLERWPRAAERSQGEVRAIPEMNREVHLRGTRTTIAGIVCHQVNHGAAPGAAQAVGRHKSPAGGRLQRGQS